MDKRIKYLFLILLISSSIFVSNANAALFPFSDIRIAGKSLGCWTIQAIGFSPFTCSLGNNTLHFIHGSGINITEFPTNHTLWFNATAGTQGPAGPQGPQGNPTSLNFTTNPDFDFRFIPRNMSYVQLLGQIFTFQMKSNVILANESDQTITKPLTINDLILGGDENVGTNALTKSGHKSTLPSTSGVLCQVNQTGTCGAISASITSINSQTGPAISLVRGAVGNITITNSTNLISINTGQNIANLATTNNQTFSGKVNFTGSSKLAPINLGMLSNPPTNLKQGDLFMDSSTGNNLKYRSSANAIVTTAGIQTNNAFAGANTYSNNQTINTGQNLYMGTANVTTSAVRGFLYLPTVDGIPTGTPASHTGGTPCVFDGKELRIYCFSGSWKFTQLG